MIRRFFEKLLTRTIKALLRFVVFPVVRMVWVRRVTGIDTIPAKEAALVAFNHQGYFDFIGFMAITPRPVYYLAAEKFYTKETHWIWGPIMEATGQIRVERRQSGGKEAVYDAVYEHLKKGDLIGIFPEGTRAPSDNEMLRAFPGVGRFSVEGKVPIIPIGIKGAYGIMSRHDKWPRLKKQLEFIVGDPIHTTTYHGKNLDKEAYQDIADDVMRVISRLSDKPYPYE